VSHIKKAARADIEKRHEERAAFWTSLEKYPEFSPQGPFGTIAEDDFAFSNISVLLKTNPPAGTVPKSPQGSIAVTMPQYHPKNSRRHS